MAFIYTCSAYILVMAVVLQTVVADKKLVETDVTSAAIQGSLNSQTNNIAQPNYVPHATYPYADSFMNYGASDARFDGYLVPTNSLSASVTNDDPKYISTLISGSQTTLAIALKLLAKVGLFLAGGVALLFVGGLFTIAVCSLTPFCTISFTNLPTLNDEKMRSLVTPDNLSSAATFVQDALDKYQRLERAVNSNH